MNNSIYKPNEKTNLQMGRYFAFVLTDEIHFYLFLCLKFLTLLC